MELGIWVVCSGQWMVNDVVAAGNVYLTNSYGDFIWKVTMEGIASVFAKNHFLVTTCSCKFFSGMVGIEWFSVPYRGNLSSGGASIFRCNVQSRFGECKSSGYKSKEPINIS